MRNLKKFFNIIKMTVVSSLIISTATPVLHAGYINFEYEDECSIIGSHFPRSLNFNFDPEGAGIIFWAYEQDGDATLLMFKLQDNAVLPEVDLGILPGGCNGLSTAMGPDGHFHLVWVNGSGELYYTEFDGTSILDPMHLDTAGFTVAAFPMIDVAHTGDVHIGFPGGSQDIIYIRSVDGEFQPPLQLFLNGKAGVFSMDLDCGAGDFPVFTVNNANGELFVFSFDGDGFTDPVSVPGANPVSGKPWILVEDTGKIHLFFNSRHTRVSGKKFIQGYHQAGYLDSGFEEKEMIDHDAETFEWMEPRIDSQGVIYILGIREYDDGLNDWRGYLFFKNGYTFGNYELISYPSESLPIDTYQPFVYDSFLNEKMAIVTLHSDGFATVSIFKRIEPEEPEVKINVSYDYLDLDYQDLIFIDLSLCNPLSSVLYADLYILFEYNPLIGGIQYYYLSAEPVYPAFSEVPVPFHLNLQPGDWYQHLPLLSIDMSPLGPEGINDFDGDFFAALFDPETGEMINIYSTAFFKYDGWDYYN